MNYSLSYSLGKTMVVTRGDADANAYIAAVEAAGATVTSTQRNAIDDFYVAAKTNSYYTSLKRLYFPIWGVAAANAIDMISLTSGTFNGGVTHGAGFVQGNGTTGYFNAGNFGTLGLSKTDFSSTICIYDITNTDGATYWGLGNARFTAIRRQNATNTERYYCSNGAFPAVPPTGIINLTINGSRLLTTRQVTAGFSTLENVAVPAGTFPTGDVYVMGYNLAGDSGTSNTPIITCDGKLGFYGWGLALSDAQNQAFSAGMKTLFEGTTGLNLP